MLFVLRHCHGARVAAAMAISVSALVPLSGCRNHDFADTPANYREFAYVSNGQSDSVSVFDVVNVRLDRELPVGHNPTGVTANPKRKEVYVVNTGGNSRSVPSGTASLPNANGSVSVISTETNAVVATIPVQKQPYFIEIDPAGDRAYVANSGSNSVSVLDLDNRREIAVVGAGESPGLARVSADGKTLLVTNRVAGSVTLFQLAEHNSASPIPRLRKVIEGCPGATDAAILPDSSKAFIACSSGHQVMVIALARTDTKSARLEQASSVSPANPASSTRPDMLEAMLDVGHSPVHLALKPDGGEVFVSNFDSDSISEIVTSTNDVGGSYLMGSHPVGALVSQDNSLLYVSNFRSQELSVYAIDDGKRTAHPIHVGDGPDAMAFSASGRLLFAVDALSGDIAVIRTSSASLFTLLPTGRQPNAIAIKAFKAR